MSRASLLGKLNACYEDQFLLVVNEQEGLNTSGDCHKKYYSLGCCLSATWEKIPDSDS